MYLNELSIHRKYLSGLKSGYVELKYLKKGVIDIYLIKNILVGKLSIVTFCGNKINGNHFFVLQVILLYN